MNKLLIRKRRPWDLSTWIWLLNRIAGLVILAYLITHILVIGIVGNGQEAFNEVMKKLHNPVMLCLEFLLIMAVMAHGLNGLRHIFIDFGFSAPDRHKKLFWVAAGIGVVFFIAAGSIILPALSGSS